MANGSYTGGTITGTAASSYEMRIIWSSTKYSSTQSTVNVTLQARSKNSSSNASYNGSYTAITYIDINGSRAATKNNLAIDFRNNSNFQTILTASSVVTHDSDGTKTVSITGYLNTNGPQGFKTGTITTNATLDNLLSLKITGPYTWSGNQGSEASFSVSVSGGSSYTYQWYFDGSAVGSNSSTYIRTVSISDNGKTVYCKVTDSSGMSATSSTVYCYVSAVVITTSTIPDFIVAYEGDDITATTSGSGGTSYSYKWYIDGVEVGNAQTLSETASYSYDGKELFCQVTDTVSKAVGTTNKSILRIGSAFSQIPISTSQVQPVLIGLPLVQTQSGVQYANWTIERDDINNADRAKVDNAIVG